MATTILGLFRRAGDADPLGDLHALGLWTETQPPNDFLGIQEAMVRMLEDMAAKRPKVTPNRVRAVLELDRISMPVQARLRSQFLQPVLAESVRQRLWHAGDDLARWFAYTYEHLFECLQEFFLSQKAKTLLPGVVTRLFHYRGEQAKNSLFRYERWIPGRWKGLHAGFAAARQRGLACVPFAFTADSPAFERYSAEQEYVQILLMQRVNTGTMSALQIEMAAAWLRGWAHTLALSEPPLEGTGFWLDLGLGDGLLLRKPQSAQGPLLYLDIAPLQKEITDGLVELSVQMRRVGAPAVQGEATGRLALLQRLQQLWGAKAIHTERRGVRVPTDRRVDVSTGLAAIAAALQGGLSADGAMQRSLPRGEPVDATSGSAQPISGAADAGFGEYDLDRAREWRVRDTSESGCKLVSLSREGARQKPGDLVGIQEIGDTRLKIGIVRRLKKSSGGQTEVGVEIVAQNSLLITPKPVASRDTGYSVDGIDVSVEGRGFAALYLPPMQLRGGTPQRSIVVPALEYAERRRFVMTFDNHANIIELTSALERTKEWVWSRFDIVTQAQ